MTTGSTKIKNKKKCFKIVHWANKNCRFKKRTLPKKIVHWAHPNQNLINSSSRLCTGPSRIKDLKNNI